MAEVISTGFPSLDKAVDGGFRLGELVVLGGDAAVGTSSLALGIALAATTRGCVFLSGEMSSERVTERALSIQSGVWLRDLHSSARTAADEQQLAFARRDPHVRSLVVRSINHTGIGAVSQAVADNPEARLIVVDGLESLLTTSHARDEELAFAVLSLKRLAVEAHVAILLVSHLPLLQHDRDDRRPRLTDFGACGACAVHADLVLGLYREEIYTRDMSVEGAAELLVLKWRSGASGYVDLFFVAPSLRFEDVLDGGGTQAGTIDLPPTANASLESVMLDLGIDDSIMGMPVIDDEL